MVNVIEYGDNIGTLKNVFWDRQDAINFAQKIIFLSENKYECIGQYEWYCQEKQEYIKVEVQ